MPLIPGRAASRAVVGERSAASNAIEAQPHPPAHWPLGRPKQIVLRTRPRHSLRLKGHSGILVQASVDRLDGAMDDLFRTVSDVVLADAPPGAVIVGLSISPDARRAAALTLLPSANYLMDDLYELAEGAWESREGGSGGPGINWSGGDVGVLRFSGAASGDSQTAIILYEGREHRVAVNRGYFVFVAWATPFSHNPVVVRFE